MRRLIFPIVIVLLVSGAEKMARRLEDTVPTPVIWTSQFTQDKADQIAALDEQVEVVFAGSSVAQAGLDPDLFIATSQQFGTAYNAAIPSATPQIWREFLLDTVYRATCPSVVVIGVDLRQFNDNKPGADAQLDRYLNSRGRLEAVGSADVWVQAENWLESRSALFRIRARLREPDKIVAWLWRIGDRGDWRNTNLTPLGRYQSFDRRVFDPSEERLQTLRDGAFLDMSMGGLETEAVRQMIEDASSRGALPVIVEMPAMNDQLAAALPGGQADVALFTEVLSGIAAEYDVPFIRMPELDDRPELYSDYYHMNLTGVEEISTLLAERIDQLQLDAGTGICSPTTS